MDVDVEDQKNKSPFWYLIKLISYAEIPLYLYFWVSAILHGGLWGVLSGLISGVVLTFITLFSVYLSLSVGLLIVLMSDLSINEWFTYIRLGWSMIDGINIWFATIWNDDSKSFDEYLDQFDFAF